MKRWVRDIIYSCVLLVFCAVMWIESNGFVQNLIKVEIAKPTAYAHLWIGLLAALAVLQLIRALKNKPDEELPRIFTPLAIITLGSLVVYVATVRLLGFLLDTFLLMSLLLLSYAAAMKKIDRTNKKKMILQILMYLAIAFVITFAVKYVFTELLSAKLPKGTIFN